MIRRIYKISKKETRNEKILFLGLGTEWELGELDLGTK